jgi:hypothetical protein
VGGTDTCVSPQSRSLESGIGSPRSGQKPTWLYTLALSNCGAATAISPALWDQSPLLRLSASRDALRATRGHRRLPAWGYWHSRDPPPTSGFATLASAISSSGKPTTVFLLKHGSAHLITLATISKHPNLSSGFDPKNQFGIHKEISHEIENNATHPGPDSCFVGSNCNPIHKSRAGTSDSCDLVGCEGAMSLLPEGRGRQARDVVLRSSCEGWGE